VLFAQFFWRKDNPADSIVDEYVSSEFSPEVVPWVRRAIEILEKNYPRRVENLLPACKNLGVTHLTNGCYRVHPVEWNVGEAAGALVSFCLAQKKQPREVRNKPELLADFQKLLRNDGVRLEWPKEAGPI